MKIEKFNKALDYIDYDLIDEFVRESEALERKKARKKAFIGLIPAAACFVLLVSVGSTLLGYNLAKDKDSSLQQYPNNAGQIQLYFEKEGKFLFEYNGTVYQAYVSPSLDESDAAFVGGESVSIQNVGEHISNVVVTDENGNVATLEIYSSKNTGEENEILLKLDYGYFLASSIEKK